MDPSENMFHIGQSAELLFKGFPLPAYLWSKSGSTMVLSGYNDAALKLTEGKVASLLNTTLEELYGPDNEVVSDILACLKNMETFSKTINYTLVSTGAEKVLYVTYSYIEDEMVLVYTEDITDFRKTERDLREGETLFRTVINGISEALVAVDSKGKILWINPSTERMFGYTNDELSGQVIEVLVPEAMRSLHKTHRKEYMNNPHTRPMGINMNLSARHKEGRTFPVEIGLNFIQNEDEQLVIALISDITERMRAEEMLKEAAQTDPLTGLFNRRAFTEQLEGEIKRSQRNNRKFSFVICDIDDFKQVNDSLGHNTGDAVLKHIAELICEKLRTYDFVGRWGGEEFVLLLPDTDIKGASFASEKIRLACEKDEYLNSLRASGVTMSFGVVTQEGECKLEQLVSVADSRLYAAKDRGKNRVVSGDDCSK